jgi:hypothetical protein
MKISDIDNATKVIRILQNTRYQLKQMRNLRIEQDSTNHIFNMGNKITSDQGFGVVPNELYLSGVYVTNEIKNLTIEVLEDQEIKLMDYLESIGVEMYGENKLD